MIQYLKENPWLQKLLIILFWGVYLWYLVKPNVYEKEFLIIPDGIYQEYCLQTPMGCL